MVFPCFSQVSVGPAHPWGPSQARPSNSSSADSHGPARPWASRGPGPAASVGCSPSSPDPTAWGTGMECMEKMNFWVFSSITRQVTKIFPRISKELVAFMFCRCIKVIKLQMMQNDFACLPSFPLCNTLPSLSFQAMQLLPCNLSMAIRHWLSPMSAIIAAFQGL